MLNKRMIFGPMTAEQREFMSHTQEELEVKHKRTSEIGALWFLGFFALISAVVNHLFLGVLYESAVMQILVTVAAVIISVASFVFAVRIGRQPATSIAENLSKWYDNDLYTPEEICDYYREVRENQDNLFFLFGKNHASKEDESNSGVFTRNWMKIPNGMMHARYSDIVAAWHNIDHRGTEFTGFYLLRIDGELTETESTQEYSEKLLAEIEKHNPLTILARSFTYEGKQYDAVANKNQVIELYKRNLDRYLKESGK